MRQLGPEGKGAAEIVRLSRAHAEEALRVCGSELVAPWGTSGTISFLFLRFYLL